MSSWSLWNAAICRQMSAGCLRDVLKTSLLLRPAMAARALICSKVPPHMGVLGATDIQDVFSTRWCV
jgi:hypothetical protein